MRESDVDVALRSLKEPLAFTAIFDRYVDVVRRFVAARVPVDDVDDVVAEVFRIAFERRIAFDGRFPTAGHWLIGIAANVIRHRQRSWTRRAAALRRLHARTMVEIDPLIDTGARIDATSMSRRLISALEQLRPDDRDVLLLVAWEQLTPSEVAIVFGVPPATIRTRLHRARQQLRQQLTDMSDGHEREVMIDGPC